MSDISPSAIKTDANLEEAISKAQSPSEVLAACRAAALRQELVVEDFDPAFLIPTAKAAAPTPLFVKTLNLNGVPTVLEADSELGLAQAETAFFKQLTQTREADQVAQAAAAALRTEPVRESQDATVETDAVAAYFRAQGVSMNDLKEISQTKFEQSWASATVDFLKSEGGQDWPGSAENLQRIGKVIHEQKWIDAPDKVAALTQAYEIMKRDGLVVETPAMRAHKTITEATSFEEIRTAAHSSMFGR